MYKINDKKVKKDIVKLKQNEVLYKNYLDAVDDLRKNGNDLKGNYKHFGPYKSEKSNGLQIYHLDISLKHRLFYTITDDEIIIENITFDGLIRLIQAWGHDLERK